MISYRVTGLFTLALVLALIAIFALVWSGVGADENPDTSPTSPGPESSTPAQLCANDTTVGAHAARPDLVADCAVLMAAKDTLQGTADLDWSYDSYIGDWEGIIVETVDDSHRVTELHLSFSELNGTIPAGLSKLSSLKKLELHGTSLSGGIPPELGDLSSLTQLFLPSNDLSGEIPSELGKLTELTILSLSDNELTGAIPSELGNLTKLTRLHLNENQLTGAIPEELAYLVNLRRIYLDGNQFTGCVPTGLFDVERGDLDSLDLAKCAPGQHCTNGIAVPNRDDRPGLLDDCAALMAGKDALQGTITLNWSYERYIGDWQGITVDDSNRVTKLKLNGSFIDGIIPPELGELSSLQALDLRDRAVSGSIPPELGKLSSLQNLLLVNHPDLKGEIPEELGELSSLQHMRISETGLTGRIPAELGYLSFDGSTLRTLDLSSNKLTGTIPATLVYLVGPWKLSSLSLGGNQFTGCVPADLLAFSPRDLASLGLPTCTQEQLCADDITVPGHADNPGLVSDCAALIPGRDTLRGAADLNWRYGLPINDWEGVTVGPGTKRVVSLDLRDKGLTGSVPPELGGLGQMRKLNLAHNQLTGTIPGELSGLSSLKELRLGANLLHGGIPEGLGDLPALEQLWLNDNQLAGAIPTKLGSISTLTHLILRDNQLTGEIPADLGNLTRLTNLALNNNSLTGGLSLSIYKLRHLEVLRVSGNPFDGCLPWGEEFYLSDVDTDLDEIDLPVCAVPAAEVCADDTVVPAHADNPGLVADCAALIGGLDTLWGTADLNWKYGRSIDAWEGVRLDPEAKRVVKLVLRDKGLTGSVPPELGGLTQLTVLNLAHNQLTGIIPGELGGLSSLEELRLGANLLHGRIPGGLGDLTALQQLWLNDNQLAGAIPARLGSMSTLTHIILRDNQLTGEIPANLGNLTRLTHLALNNNSLTGGLPPSIYNLRYLEVLRVSGNPLDGCLPPGVDLYLPSTATDLDEIALPVCATPAEEFCTDDTVVPGHAENPGLFSDCIALYQVMDQLDDNENLSWNPTLSIDRWDGVSVSGSPSRVTRLELNDKALIGVIPAEVGNLTNLEYLDLSDNQLWWAPGELGQLTKLQHLDLRNNKLKGFGKSFGLGSLTALRHLDLSNNPINRSHRSNYGARQLGNLVDLRYADLSNSGLYLQANVVDWGKLVNLSYLDLSVNHISRLPDQRFADMTNLRHLDLSHNPLLSGESVPAWLGDLTGLQFLDLSFTQLAGPIPGELGNLTNLEYLDISGGDPVSDFTETRVYLEGALPPELGSLSKLKHLAIHTQGLTGSLPRELGNLSALKFLHIGGNKFSGNIPIELDNLDNLQFLRAYWPGILASSCVERGLRLIGVDHDIGDFFHAPGQYCPSSQ